MPGWEIFFLKDSDSVGGRPFLALTLILMLAVSGLPVYAHKSQKDLSRSFWLGWLGGALAAVCLAYEKGDSPKKWVDYWMNTIDTNNELVESDKAKLYQGLRQDYASKELRKCGNLFDELGY